MSIIAQLYLSKALRSSEVGLYFVVKLGRENKLKRAVAMKIRRINLHTGLFQCVEDNIDLISVL